MSKTERDLVKAALLKIGVLDSHEEPSGTDFTYARDQYRNNLERWRDDGLVYWERDEIPEVVFAALEKLLANEIEIAFGARKTVADAVAAERILIRELRRHMTKKPSGQSTEFCSF